MKNKILFLFLFNFLFASEKKFSDLEIKNREPYSSLKVEIPGIKFVHKSIEYRDVKTGFGIEVEKDGRFIIYNSRKEIFPDDSRRADVNIDDDKSLKPLKKPSELRNSVPRELAERRSDCLPYSYVSGMALSFYLGKFHD